MKVALERKIACVARERGISFANAAAMVARRGARKRRAGIERRRRERDQLTRLRGTWAWRRDFEQ